MGWLIKEKGAGVIDFSKTNLENLNLLDSFLFVQLEI